MKLLILSCGTGEGHNRAAGAIAEAAARLDIETNIIDAISFQSEKARARACSLYNNIIRKSPAIFGMVYKVGAFYSSTELPSPIYFANALYANKLAAFITENKYDVVVCTHLYAMEAMTAIRWREKKNKIPRLNVKCYGVLTDYTAIPFTNDTHLDGYFVGDEDVKTDMQIKGMQVDKVICSGIPVSGAFACDLTKDQARALLDMPKDRTICLVMSGGVGCGDLLSLCNELDMRGDKNLLVYVLVGRNEEAKQDLMERYGEEGRIRAVSFTDKVPQYMKAADVLISKPGGLSSTEAAVANVPMVHVSPIPGCESVNVEFFSARGMSVYAQSAAEAATMALSLANAPEKAERMREWQRKYIPKDAADALIRKIVENENN